MRAYQIICSQDAYMPMKPAGTGSADCLVVGQSDACEGD
jgi:hypothetical protein